MAEAKPSKKSETKKVFDVSKQSEVPAGPTSRPIIVGHGKPFQQDPMVVPEESSASDAIQTEPETVMDKPKHEMKLEPTTPDPQAEEEKSEESVVEETPAVEEEKPEEPEEKLSPDSDAAAVDALADSVSIKREQEEALEKEEKARQEVEKLIASKQYYVKIKTPPAKRNMRMLIVLVLLVVAAAGWYLLLGPGKELWAKSEPVAVSQPAPVATTNSTAKAPVVEQTSEYKNVAQGISFSYPKAWKAETAKSTVQVGTETITLTSDEQKVKLAADGGGESEVGAQLRMTIGVLNTTNTTKYPTNAVGLLLCKTEVLAINKVAYSLAIISDKSATNPNAAILAPSTCSAAKPFKINDQFQFADKKNTYTLKLEYVLGENYLKSIETTDPSEIKLAQTKGIALSEANFKAANAYKDVQKTIQSLKSVQ